MDIDFDDLDGYNVAVNEEDCPTCGVFPALEGPTPGCHDPEGCGKVVDDDYEDDDYDCDNEEDYDLDDNVELDFE